MKRGDKVGVCNPSRYSKVNINETTIKSIGKKYITTNYDDRIKFDINTLQEVDGRGYCSYLILDLEEYTLKVHYRELRYKISKFNFNSLSDKEIDEIAKILGLGVTEYGN